MKRSEFVKQYQEKNPPPQNLTYQEGLDLAYDAYDDYREQYSEQQRRGRAIQERFDQKRLESLKAHADFDQVCPTDAVLRMMHSLAPSAALTLRDETDNPTEIFYHLLSNPGELARIRSLSPGRQVSEIFRVSESLSAPPSAAEPAPKPDPEYPQKVRPISRVPAPQRHVLGGGAASALEGPNPLDSSYENWRSAENRRTKKA